MQQNSKKTTDKNPYAFVLNKKIISDWQQALLDIAKIKGLDPELAAHDKVKAILKQELKNIRQLWETFTVERSQISRYLLDPKKQTAAYLAGFHLPNLVRLSGTLERLRRFFLLQNLLKEYSNIHTYDWGCGTGAMSQAWAFFLDSTKLSAKIKLKWSLVDQYGSFLDTTRTLLTKIKPKAEIQSSKSRIEDFLSRFQFEEEGEQGTLHTVLMGYLWNELQNNPKAQRLFLEKIQYLATKDAMIIAIEPANQNPSREAMQLREQLRESGWCAIYPCPKSNDCPMLEHPKDWCFSEFYWERPAIFRWLDERLERDNSKLSCSAFVFVSPRVHAKLVPSKQAKENPRAIVGRPQIKTKLKKPSKRFEYLLCDGQSLSKVEGTGPNRLLRGERLVEPQ